MQALNATSLENRQTTNLAFLMSAMCILFVVKLTVHVQI